MTVNDMICKMIAQAGGNKHDIAHFLKVYTYARLIGEKEQLDARTQETLEITAVIHDIACPLCREKYGNTNGSNQELESPPLVETFFEGLPVDPADLSRISFLVAHHHTDTGVDGLDYQILLEADFLVNAGESGYSRAVIEKFRQRVFRTKSGIRLLDSIYLGEAEKD